MPGPRREEAVRWYRQAAQDLRAARWNLEGEFFDTACFLCQQAAEKALKSVLYHTGARREALLTHAVFEMLQQVQDAVPVAEESLEAGRRLDLHYVASRYPNGLPSGYPHAFYSKGIAGQALADADKLFAMVRAYYRGSGDEGLLQEPGGGEAGA